VQRHGHIGRQCDVEGVANGRSGFIFCLVRRNRSDRDLGFSIGLGGLGAIPMGFIGDQIGILPILVFCAALAPLAGLLALRLPD